MRAKITTNKRIDLILQERMEIAATRTELLKFGVKKPSLDLFKSNLFQSTYKKWDDKTREKFLVCLGGVANLNKTKSYIENKPTEIETILGN